MAINDTKIGMTKDALVAAQMQMPEKLQIEEISPNHCRFILQPLEQGYGVTIGNSFRRVLLSSIPGSAIIGVKITDVLHEFQTIPGVIEDMTEIILNLKEVRFKHIDKKVQKISFLLKGPCMWTDKTIQDATGAIEMINPEHHIAELAEDGEFEVELRIGRGLGYIPAEEQQLVDYPIGMLPIDAVFTPINNVIYTIDPYRVGQKTDYERLTLDVLSDGTTSPQEAVNFSAKLIMEHVKYFSHIDDFDDDSKHLENPEDEVKEAEKNKIRKILLTPVDELELSVRAHNCLKAANIKFLAELVQLQEHELLKFRNFGRKSLTELTEVVQQFGLDFGMDVEKILNEDNKSSEILNHY